MHISSKPTSHNRRLDAYCESHATVLKLHLRLPLPDQHAPEQAAEQPGCSAASSVFAVATHDGVQKLAFSAMLKRRTQGLHPHIKDAEEVKSLVCSIVSTSAYKSNVSPRQSTRLYSGAAHGCVTCGHLQRDPPITIPATLSRHLQHTEWAGCSRATSSERTLTSVVLQGSPLCRPQGTRPAQTGPHSRPRLHTPGDTPT